MTGEFLVFHEGKMLKEKPLQREIRSRAVQKEPEKLSQPFNDFSVMQKRLNQGSPVPPQPVRGSRRLRKKTLTANLLSAERGGLIFEWNPLAIAPSPTWLRWRFRQSSEHAGATLN